jgi:hypothetical protein
MEKSTQSKRKNYRVKRQMPANGVPPQFKSEIMVTRRIRFKATAAVAEVSLQVRDISSGVAGIVAVTTTTSGILARAIRLRSLEMWFTAATAGTPVEGIIDWNSLPGTAFVAGPGSSISEYSTSLSEYTHLRASPPVGSSASFWRDAADTSSIVTLTIPAGGIIDITCDFVYNDSNAVVSGASISGATVGLWYHKQPDTNLQVMGNLNSIA